MAQGWFTIFTDCCGSPKSLVHGRIMLTTRINCFRVCKSCTSLYFIEKTEALDSVNRRNLCLKKWPLPRQETATQWIIQRVTTLVIMTYFFCFLRRMQRRNLQQTHCTSFSFGTIPGAINEESFSIGSLLCEYYQCNLAIYVQCTL